MFQQVNSDTHKFSTSFLETNFKKAYSKRAKTRKKSRPSASSSLCPRQIALGIEAPERWYDKPKALEDYAALGNAIEENVLRKYRSAGQLYLDQWKIPEQLTKLGLNVGGIIDAFIEIDGELVLLDIKTVGAVESAPYIQLHSHEVNDLVSGVDLVFPATDKRLKETIEKGVKDSHIAQLQLYAAITGIDNVYIQLMSRKVQDTYTTDGDPSVKFEMVPVSTSSLEKRVAIVHYAERCRELGYLPDKLAGIKKTMCSDAFCEFQAFCWKDEDCGTSLQPIPAEMSVAIKLESIEFAKEYIAKRPERKELTLKLLADEKLKRDFAK